MPLIERCVCNGRMFSVVEAHGLPMRECRSCGILHQSVDMDRAGLSEWYRDTYHRGVYGHSYEQDYLVATKRIARYGDYLRGPALDIGCGNGAFVDACLKHGIHAEGQDLGGAAGHRCGVEALTGQYATITMHDVLEHVVDPAGMLGSVRGLLGIGGKLIVDFPAFFDPAGAHHWKKTEHIWMLSERQVMGLLNAAGFVVLEQDQPIPGKIVFYAA